MPPSTWCRRALLATAVVLSASLGPRSTAVAIDAPREMAPACPPERAQDGEVRLVFLGDSGYGRGFSDWGAPGQEAVAARLARLRLPPDLVFFLGDNVYWQGSADLYKSRFDDVYEPLIRECRAHVALGNHDVKGCRAVEEYLPGDATAYEDAVAGKKTCNAAPALAHAPFGFGSIEKGDPPRHLPQRYYSIHWPPRLTWAGAVADSAASPPTRPLVDVMVLDSNTLDVEGGMLGEGEGGKREDERQLLWLRNAMSQWRPAPGETHRTWKLVVMHHPPHTPRTCACRIFGKCLGGHRDETRLREQLRKTLEDLEPPDMVLAGHNHIYARSHPLDASGRPVTTGKGGVRHFVTGGGGAPLYAINGNDPRFPQALAIHHFVYLRLTASNAFYWAIDAEGQVRDSGCFEKGSNVDHPLRPSFHYDDSLPPRCTAEGD